MQFVTFCENVHIMLRYTIRYRVVCLCVCVCVLNTTMNQLKCRLDCGLWWTQKTTVCIEWEVGTQHISGGEGAILGLSPTEMH